VRTGLISYKHDIITNEPRIINGKSDGEGQGEGNVMSSRVAARAKEKRPAESPRPLIQPTTANSGIRDNYRRGTVGDFLKDKIQAGSSLSIVSAYFTIYAFEALKTQLNGIASLRFLFGEPRFLTREQ